jgi:3-hydroxyisobutyrate dehydrogenase-like beta-hydroxyacid dehydrogenase
MAVNSVSIIGLGLMGSALARATISAGLDITVWNRSPSKAQTFVDGPARIALTVEEAVDASEVIVVCVRDHDATNEAFRKPTTEKRLADKIVVQLSTGTPTQAREASAWAAGVGAQYLDGSIMGFPQDIGTDGLVILYGGDQDTFERYGPIAAALGGTAMRVGDDPGSAAALDNALLSIYFSFLFGVLNGAAICDAEGIPLAKFSEVGKSLMPVFSGVLERSAEMIARGSFESEHSTLDTSSGAMAQIAAVMRDAELDGRFVECMRTYIAEATEAGKGNLGNAVLFEHLRHRS